MLVYHNPWFTNGEHGFAWYLHQPLSGLKTMVAHVFSAFDFDYLFCYIYNLTPNYRIGLFLFSHFIVFWGIYGYFALTIKSFSQKFWQENSWKNIASIAFILMYPALFAGWLMIYTFTAMENRFSLSIVTLLLPLAVWSCATPKSTRQKIILSCAFILYLIVAWKFSHFISSLGVLE